MHLDEFSRRIDEFYTKKNFYSIFFPTTVNLFG